MLTKSELIMIRKSASNYSTCAYQLKDNIHLLLAHIKDTEEGFTNENCFVDPDSDWKKAESHLKCIIQDYEEFTRVFEVNIKSNLSALKDIWARYNSGERNLDLYTKMICAT